MNAETEGVVLKHIKAVNGRKMILLFSKKYGKISAATGGSEKGKNRFALALKPFTHGRYDLFKGRDIFNINSAEVIKAYYKIGEDVEKYMCASFILEFTERILPENMPSVELFRLLLDFFDLIEARKKKYTTLVIAYQLKAIQLMGLAPELLCCVRCGAKEDLAFFDVKQGGAICVGCRNNITGSDDELIYILNSDIINPLLYFLGNNLKSVGHLALDDTISTEIQDIIREYRAYHLCIKEIKSEDFLKKYQGG